MIIVLADDKYVIREKMVFDIWVCDKDRRSF